MHEICDSLLLRNSSGGDPVTSEEALRVAACSSSNTDYDPLEDFCHSCDHYFGSRKRLRLSYSEPFHAGAGARTCAGAMQSPLHASIDGCFSHGQHVDFHDSSTGCEPMEKVGFCMAMEGNPLSSNNQCSTSQPSDGGSHEGVSSGGYSQNPSVSGWAYLNENGQMCGPYIQEQLCEGLSTGFLPPDLPVYPIINGSLMNPIALKQIGQFSSHLYFVTSDVPTTVSQSSANHSMPAVTQLREQGSTASYSPQMDYAKESVNKTHGSYGACISGSHASTVKTGNLASTGLSNMNLNERSCWVFEDERGSKHGPHSLAELHHWYQNNYLHDNVMIYHIDKKFERCTLKSLVDNLSMDKNCDESIFLDGYMAGISGKIALQLHSVIMKTARRIVLDEIVSTIIPEFVASRKAHKQTKPEPANKSVKSCSQTNERPPPPVLERKKSSLLLNAAAAVPCSVDNQMNPSTMESHASPKPTQSIIVFPELLAVSRKLLHDDCMKVMWNAVFYDSVAEYCNTWRKRKRWSCYPLLVGPMGSVKQDMSHTKKTGDTSQCSHNDVKLETNPMPDMDFPPGFGPGIENLSIDQTSLVSRGSHCTEMDITQRTSCNVNSVSSDIHEIHASVENALFLSATTALIKYVGDIIDAEVDKLYIQATEVEPNADKNVGEMSCQPASEQALVDLGSSVDLPSGGKPCSPSVFCARFFEKFQLPESDNVDVQENDEPPPPGLDQCTMPLKALRETKFKPPKFEEYIPMTDAYIGLAICRQRLHADVLRHWKRSFLSDALYEHFLSWFGSRHHDTGISRASTDGRKLHSFSEEKYSNIRDIDSLDLSWSIRERTYDFNCARTARIPLVDGKYTYFRKKWFGKKKLESVPESMKPLGGDVKSNVISSLTRNESVSSQGERSKCSTELHQSKPAKNKKSMPDRSNMAKKKNMHLLGKRVRLPSSCAVKNKKRAVSKEVLTLSGVIKSKVSEDDLTATKDNLAEMSVCEQDLSKIEKSLEHGACVVSGKLQKKKVVMPQLKRKMKGDQRLCHPSKSVQVLGATLGKKVKGRDLKAQKANIPKFTVSNPCPKSEGCARSSINGWEWRGWSQKASPSDRSWVRGIQFFHSSSFRSEVWASQCSSIKGPSARTNRVKLRNLLAAAEGSELLKVTQLTARKKRLRFQRSKIHDWGLVALEPIEAEDFVIEYVGELIRRPISEIRERQYEKMGIGSSYLFRLDDDYVCFE